MLKNCSTHLTLLSRDNKYRQFVFGKTNLVSPIGLLYQDLHQLANSHDYKRFEKSNKTARKILFKLNRQRGAYMLDLLRYKKSLLGHGNMKIIDQLDHPYFYKNSIRPLLKWPGGKSSDLKQVREQYSDLLPSTINNYYEPFAGGMAVSLMMNVDNIFINDLCPELIDFYKFIRDEDVDFYNIFQLMTNKWNEIAAIASQNSTKIYVMSDDELKQFLLPFKKSLESNLFAPEYSDKFVDTLTTILVSKMSNIRRAERKNGNCLPPEDITSNMEGALKAGFYTFVRDVYNIHPKMDALKVVTFYFLREYCFSSMFRYNASGGFNVPYGGLSYNPKSPDAKVSQWKNPNLIAHLKRTTFGCMDFLEFLRKHTPSPEDFIFLDPPYDSEFSTYAKNSFGQDDQKRLATYLIHECKANFMAIMKATPFIRDLYEGKSPDINCRYFDKNYSVSFMDRNDREVQHVIITRNK